MNNIEHILRTVPTGESIVTYVYRILASRVALDDEILQVRLHALLTDCFRQRIYNNCNELISIFNNCSYIIFHRHASFGFIERYSPSNKNLNDFGFINVT